MRRSFLKKVLASLATAAGAGRGVATAQTTGDGVKPVEVFALSELLGKQAQSGKPWLPFLKVPSTRRRISARCASTSIKTSRPPRNADITHVVDKS